MSKAEILIELSKLPPEDRAEIQAKLDELAEEGWLDGEDPLTDADKALIDSRIQAHEKSPEAAIPWSEFDAQFKRRLGE